MAVYAPRITGRNAGSAPRHSFVTAQDAAGLHSAPAPGDNPGMSTSTRLKLRLEYDAPLVLGPGKAQLLTLIDQRGSISAAGREMGMSYKRAWSLVEEMNAAFTQPVVDSSRGGPGGGGASLTDTGREVLARFRRLEQILETEGAKEIAGLAALLKP